MAETNVYINGKLQPKPVSLSSSSPNTQTSTWYSCPRCGQWYEPPYEKHRCWRDRIPFPTGQGAVMAMLHTTLIDLQTLFPDDWRDVVQRAMERVSE